MRRYAAPQPLIANKEVGFVGSSGNLERPRDENLARTVGVKQAAYRRVILCARLIQYQAIENSGLRHGLAQLRFIERIGLPAEQVSQIVARAQACFDTARQ